MAIVYHAKIGAMSNMVSYTILFFNTLAQTKFITLDKFLKSNHNIKMSQLSCDM